MMPYKKTRQTMENMKRETNYPIKNFKNIYKLLIQQKNIICLIKFYQK
jgi:hypothetical protein